VLFILNRFWYELLAQARRAVNQAKAYCAVGFSGMAAVAQI
jgi:hypothetical protein